MIITIYCLLVDYKDKSVAGATLFNCLFCKFYR